MRLKVSSLSAANVLHNERGSSNFPLLCVVSRETTHVTIQTCHSSIEQADIDSSEYAWLAMMS